MKIHNVEQGTAAWLSLRLGIPTASEFHKIITPVRGELSKEARKYAFRLVAEKLLNQSLDSLDHLDQIARGKELEPQAVRQYEFTQDVEVRKIGFVTTDDGSIGCSPDRLVVGKPIGLEVKCPAPHTHIEYWMDGPGDAYRPQVQGQLLVAELDAVDFYSFHPSMPPVLRRTNRDDTYIAKLDTALRQFCEMRDEILDRARASGFFEERKRLLTPLDEAYSDDNILHIVGEEYAGA